MDSEEESAFEEAEVESEEESDSGIASLATAYVAKSIFNTEDNDFITDTDANDKDYSASTYCFMARGAKGKVSSRKPKSSDTIAGDLKHLIGRKIKCPNSLTMYFVPESLATLPISPSGSKLS